MKIRIKKNLANKIKYYSRSLNLPVEEIISSALWKYLIILEQTKKDLEEILKI